MKLRKRIIAAAIMLTVLLCQCPVGHAAIHQHDWHYSWNNGLYAVCDLCGACASVTLNNEQSFSQCPGNEASSELWVTKDNWVSPESAGYGDTGTLANYFYIYAEEGTDAWQMGIPTQPGSYRVSVELAPEIDIEDDSGAYATRSDYVTVRIGHSADTWKADGTSLCLTCQGCAQAIAKITLSDPAEKGACTENTVTPNVTTWFIDEQTEQTAEIPNYTLLYKGKGTTKYAVSAQQPTARGTYSMYLALLTDPNAPGSAKVKTQAVNFTVKAHSWSYYTFEYALYAQCQNCGASAQVCLDTSTVYEASRTYNGTELDYEAFYEKGWSSQEDIEPYSVLFSGTQTVSETDTTLYDHAFVKPNTTGNYTVRLSLLKNQDDPDTAWLSTKEKPYYLADIPINECEVLTYGPTQIAQFTEPALVDGYYQVGTSSELLWCLSKKNSDANISLTNDIVVNPITVNEDGEIRCASYQIYKWSGFGTEKTPYTGNIQGNGYRVYGLYQPDASVHYNGFVANGKNNQISDLTVENSVLFGTDAAAIAGHYDHSSDSDNMVANCHSLNSYFSASSTCGGIIAWLTTGQSGSMKLDRCGSDCIITGNAERGAGGIIGRAEGVDALYVQNCYNLGPIESVKGQAGGLIGQADLATASAYIAIWDSFNTGSVTSPYDVGGIVGYIRDYKGSEEIFFDNCTSTGYLSAGKNVGGIAGCIETKMLYDRRTPAHGNYYYNAKLGFKTADPTVDLEAHAQKLTKSEANGNFICTNYGHTPCSHRTATASASCTRDGELTLNCAVCKAVMESESIRAYGHRYEYGECLYCGAYEDEEELIGSVFGNAPVVITVAAVSALLLLMAIWLLRNRKKKRTEPSEGNQ